MNLYLLKKGVPIIVIFACFMMQNVFGQHRITGTVTDASTSKTLPGVNIRVQGTEQGTSTDTDGNYEFQVPAASDTLIFSFVGYQTEQVPINGRLEINISLESQTLSGEELVVVGYGKQRKASVASSISSVSSESINTAPVSNVSNSLGGQVAGVISRQPSGRPGQNEATINIRGVGTTGNGAPLTIVDGIQRSYNNLNPTAIKSITVLKGPTAVAPYGLAGANGVLLVTTKEGQKGKPTVKYDGYIGIQNPDRLVNFVNSYQYAKLKNAAADNVGSQHPYSASDLKKFKNCSDLNTHPCSHPIRDVMQKNALTTHHSIEISGGSKDVTYYTDLGFVDEQGMWQPTNVKRYSVNLGLDVQATQTTDINFKVNSWNQDNNYPAPPPEGGGLNSIFYQAFRDPPTAPIYFTNGLWGGYIARSLVGEIYHSGYDRTEFKTIQSQITIDQQLSKGFSLRGRVAYDASDTTNRTWRTPIPYYSVNANTTPYTYTKSIEGFSKPRLNRAYGQEHVFDYQISLRYKNTFGKNRLSGLALGEFRNGRNNSFGASRYGFNVNIPVLNNGSSSKTNYNNYGYSNEVRRLGFVYRVQDTYADKYILEATGRYDGSYYFAPGNRWGFFPAFAAAWRLTQEKFIKNNIPSWVSSLKLRASWGEAGNLAGAPFQYESTYNLIGNAYVLGSPESSRQGLAERPEPNPNITWEKARKTDIGIDASFLDNLLNFTFDYFHDKRNNMLVTQPNSVPATYGIGLSEVNAGSMINRGIDFSVSSSHQFSNGLHVGLSATFTYAKNKLTQIFENPATYNNPKRRRTGRSLGTKFGLKALGLFQQSDDKNGDGVINSEDGYDITQFGTLRRGDIKYQDTNGDGKITAADNVPIGRPTTPKITYGFTPKFSYKGISLYLLFQGATLSDSYFSATLQHPFDNASSATVEQLDYWTPQNPDARYPRVTPNSTPNNTQYSSWWIRNTSYLRLKTAQLSYALPTELINGIGIQKLKIYLSGQNIATWSPIKGIDPEFGSTVGQYYPQQRVFTMGVHLTF